MDNTYTAGDIVYPRTNPTLRLIVRRYVDRIYYCRVKDDSDRKELVYFERELLEKSPNSK